MKSYKMTLIDNTTANFKLTFTTLYEREVNDKTVNAVWYNDKLDDNGKAKDYYLLKPSCFLEFTYVSPDDYTQTRAVSTALPHIYRIRRAFQLMHDMTYDPNAYIEVEGQTVIAPNYAEPVVIDGINLQKGDWITLTLMMATDEYTNTKAPAVAIEHSRSNGYSSILSLDEFYTLYDVIAHIDYVSLMHQAIDIYFSERKSKIAGKAETTKTPAPAGKSASKPAWQKTTSIPTQSTSGYPGMTKPAYQTTSNPAAKAAAIPTQQAYTNAAPSSNGNPMPARPATSKPKIDLASVEQMPADLQDYDMDDDAEVANVFANLGE